VQEQQEAVGSGVTWGHERKAEKESVMRPLLLAMSALEQKAEQHTNACALT
jgi:hypothetical protein